MVRQTISPLSLGDLHAVGNGTAAYITNVSDTTSGASAGRHLISNGGIRFFSVGHTKIGVKNQFRQCPPLNLSYLYMLLSLTVVFHLAMVQYNLGRLTIYSGKISLLILMRLNLSKLSTVRLTESHPPIATYVYRTF